MTFTSFFHVSMDVHFCTTFFWPRIPNKRTLSENLKTPRVCLSSTVEGALAALPLFSQSVEELERYILSFLQTRPEPPTQGIPFFMYEFHIQQEDATLVSNRTLCEQQEVEDAYWTGEWWALCPLRPSQLHEGWLYVRTDERSARQWALAIKGRRLSIQWREPNVIPPFRSSIVSF